MPRGIVARQRDLITSLGEDREGTFGGGALVLYGLADQEDLGIPFGGDVGTLVAFPSSLPHEVKKVERGVRHSIVTWFV